MGSWSTSQGRLRPSRPPLLSRSRSTARWSPLFRGDQRVIRIFRVFSFFIVYTIIFYNTLPATPQNPVDSFGLDL